MDEFIDLEKKDNNNTFSIFNYIKLISYPTLILFLISFMFIFYSINKIVEGFFLIIILTIFIYIINYLNKNNISKKNIYEIFLLFIVILYSLFLINLTLTLIILFVLIQAFFYYKIIKKHNIKTIFFTFFIGSIFTYALVSLIYKSDRYYKLLNKIVNNYSFLNETIIINLLLLLIYILITYFLFKVINKKLELFLKYLQSISILIFGLFIVSIVFLLNFFTGEFINSIIVFVLLLLQFLILDLLYKKDKLIFTKIFGIITIIFTLFLIIYYKALLLFILFLVAFINSLFYYYKSNNKDNLRYVFLNELISITFALTITSFFIIFYGYIVGLFELINFLTILITIIPLLIILFSSYLVISIYLIKKTIGFEYDAYFKFKHIRIFNFLSSKIDNIKKSIIYRTIFYTIGSFIIISLYLTSLSYYFTNNYINGMYIFDLEECLYEYINPLEEILKSKYAENEFYKYNPLLFYSIDEYYDYIKTNNISSPKISFFNNNNLITDDEIKNKDITINYNCDKNLECEIKPYSHNININDLTKQNFCIHNKKPSVISVENKTKKSIYILPNISFEDKLNFYLESRIDDNFFEIKELTNTQYINELKQKHSDLFELKYINYNINNKPKFKERIRMTFFNDIYYDYYNFLDYSYKANHMTRFGILITEYNWIKENEINNTPFYDNTTTKKEHIKKLTENIEILYNNIDFELNYRQEYDYKIYEPKLFSKIIKKILFQTLYGKLKNENIMIIHNHIENEHIIEAYNNLDVKEDELSKIIRLKAFEYKLIRFSNSKCGGPINTECYKEMNNNYNLINNKEFCKKDLNNEYYNTCFEPFEY
jgi:hypothetical protein